MSSENTGATFNRGYERHGNPMRSLDRGRPGRVAVPDASIINCHYEALFSSRRDMTNRRFSDAYWQTGELSRLYKNVTRIDLYQYRIPISNDMAVRRSLYLYVTDITTGQKLVNVNFAQPYNSSRAKDEERDGWNLDGAFAHFFITNQPMVFQEVSMLPEFTFTFPTPLDQLSRLQIELRVETGDPDRPSELLQVEEGEDVRLVFRIMSDN